jgi:hypothetical protein
VIPFVVLLVAIALAVALARLLPPSAGARVDVTPVLASRWAGWVIGALTAGICAYVWGHLIAPTAVVHDEASYLLQARIFARGAFAMPSPPLPEFFEQFHTYVTPAFASKYPPGHALLLAIGMLVGWPALMPLVLNGIAGAMVFLLARRIANPIVGLLTWFIWLTARGSFHSLASYFSETTTTALWMLGWWALLEWRDSGRRRWLVALSACVAWMAITRPLTAVGYALPVAVVVGVTLARRRGWRELLLPSLAGIAILALIPYANLRTTGDWRTMPYSQYSTIYFPWDVPGFGIDSTPPRRALPPDMVKFAAAARPPHRFYVPSALPGAFAARLGYLALDVWSGPRIVLGLVALAALPVIGLEAGLAIATTIVLVAVYLSFGHSPAWTLYYAETLPVFAFLSAAGLWSLMANVGRAGRRRALALPSAASALAASLLVVLSVPIAVRLWTYWRNENLSTQSYQRSVAMAIHDIPEPRAIVFVRYAKWHNLHKSLITNDPDFATSHVWVVYDRGDDNGRLMRLAPERAAYLYDESRLSLIRIPPGVY